MGGSWKGEGRKILSFFLGWMRLREHWMVASRDHSLGAVSAREPENLVLEPIHNCMPLADNSISQVEEVVQS